MIKSNFTFFFCILFLSTSTFAQSKLERKLFELPDVIFKKIDTPKGFEASYELQIKQPLDHQDHSKGYFYQRAFLSHRGYDRPTVLITEGYNRSQNRVYELTRLIGGNQIDIEQRFFGSSVPDSMDYQYLTFEQITADFHKVNELFRAIYEGKWVSTGISKGGSNTIFYRYFYPEDVDVAVPYVAPVNYDVEDKRIYEFLDNVGTAECRAAIKDLQIRVLEEREKALEMLKWHAKGAGYKFTYLTLEQAFEYAVLEYPFAFWQWGGDCEAIPNKKADFEDIMENFMMISGLSFYTDASMESFSSFYYQAGTDYGYYGYETEDFAHLLKALPAKPHPSAVFAPNKMEIKFDGTLTNKVAKWLETNGNDFIYIYGGYDTWTATGVPPSDKVNSKWFVLEGKDHGRARIAFMNEREKAELVKTLEGWLEIDIETGKP